MKTFILIVIAVVVSAMLSFQFGETCRQNQIEQRVLRMKEKPFYSAEEVEIIIFGESQL